MSARMLRGLLKSIITGDKKCLGCTERKCNCCKVKMWRNINGGAYPYTNAEVNLIFYLCQRCDDKGVIKGVYYKDVAETIECDATTVYNCLSSLEKKGVLNWQKGSFDRKIRNDFDIYLKHNFFAPCKKTNKSTNILPAFLNINYAFFEDENHTFYKLSLAQKRVMLYIINRISAQGFFENNKTRKSEQLTFSRHNFIKTIATSINMSTWNVRKVLKGLRFNADDKRRSSVNKSNILSNWIEICDNKDEGYIYLVAKRTLAEKEQRTGYFEHNEISTMNTHNNSLYQEHIVATLLRRLGRTVVKSAQKNKYSKSYIFSAKQEKEKSIQIISIAWILQQYSATVGNAETFLEYIIKKCCSKTENNKKCYINSRIVGALFRNKAKKLTAAG